MKNKTDTTKDLLENILSNLYKQQAETTQNRGESYLIGHDDQYLGKITTNANRTDSIFNKYGPYGSAYSSTSIFNKYSEYGSVYGTYSINNPYTGTPPRLILSGSFKKYVSKNIHVSNRITPEVFIYNLNNNIHGLLRGEFIESDLDLRIRRQESFLFAGNGVYLGKLTPNTFDNESILNNFSPYGNKFSTTSIYNLFSPYGGQFGAYSPYNPYSNNPPKIYLRGEYVGFLTKNTTLLPRVSPDDINIWINKNIPLFT